MDFDLAVIADNWRFLAYGVLVTIVLSIVSGATSLAAGLALALLRLRGPRWLRPLIVLYVDSMRAVPVLVVLVWTFFALPIVTGLTMSPFTAALIGLTVHLAAYAAEIVRAGIDATPRGQLEAARSLAMTERQVFLRVVLPPSLGRIWPAMVSQIVIVMLGSAVCGQIAAQELSYSANLIMSRNFRSFEANFVAAGLYLAMAVLLRQALAWAGPRWLFGRAAPTRS